MKFRRGRKQPNRNALIKLKKYKQKLYLREQEALRNIEEAKEVSAKLTHKLRRQSQLEEALEHKLRRENPYHPLLGTERVENSSYPITEFLNYRLSAPHLFLDGRVWDDENDPGMLKVYVQTKTPGEAPREMGVALSAAALHNDLNITTEEMIKFFSNQIATQLWGFFVQKHGNREDYMQKYFESKNKLKPKTKSAS